MIFIKRLILLLIPLLFLIPSNEDNYEEAIRLRVVANSNSEYDQQVKKEVSNNLQLEMNNILNASKSLNDARKAIILNYNLLEKNVINSLNQKSYKLPYVINYGYNYFPEKSFDGKKIAAGNYESLVVTLGEGKGDNWWCIMFPPMCLIEAEENYTEEVKYEFFFEKLFNKIFK